MFIAMDIGCIECDEKSALIGVYKTKAAAQKACDRARRAKIKQEKNWAGDHHFEVFASK